MARQWHAEHRLYCPSVPACKHAAASVFGVAGEVSDAAGGTQALLVLGSLPYFSGVRVPSPRTFRSGNHMVAEHRRAATNVARGRVAMLVLRYVVAVPMLRGWVKDLSNRLFRLSRTAGVIVALCVSVRHRISVQLTRS